MFCLMEGNHLMLINYVIFFHVWPSKISFMLQLWILLNVLSSYHSYAPLVSRKTKINVICFLLWTENELTWCCNENIFWVNGEVWLHWLFSIMTWKCFLLSSAALYKGGWPLLLAPLQPIGISSVAFSLSHFMSCRDKRLQADSTWLRTMPRAIRFI